MNKPSNRICPRCRKGGYIYYIDQSNIYEAKCYNCGYYLTFDELNLCKEKKLITNADRIRSMTDEELAEFLTTVAQNSANKLCESLKTVDVDLSNCDFDILYKTHLDWLKQEVKKQ